MKVALRLAICLIFISSFVLTQTAPPKPLHFVKDHWTPYDPPTEFPEGVEVYIIQKGDTLWDLASKKLGNPYLWPQIWENNKYIQDAHWIYPGDPLVFGPQVAETPISEGEVKGEAEAVGEEKEGEGEPKGIREPEIIARPVPLGDDSDMYCFAKITEPDAKFPLKIVDTDDPEVRHTLAQGQIVYINGGSEEGVKPGDSFLIARDEGLIKDGKEVLGRLWTLTGRITVICTQEHTSTARVDYSCQSIYRGENLIPFELQPIPARVIPPLETTCSGDVEQIHGKIIYSKDEIVSLFNGHNVIVNMGTKEGIEPGTLLKIYRWLPDHSKRIIVGRVGILATHDRASIGKILEANKEIYIGDEVELELK
ncbi:MAG: LysM peptidoglycan-binding domain-containing protein [Thermoanaerobaculia bacterium]